MASIQMQAVCSSVCLPNYCACCLISVFLITVLYCFISMLLLIKILNYRLTIILILEITTLNSDMLGEFPKALELQMLVKPPEKIQRSKVHLSFLED